MERGSKDLTYVFERGEWQTLAAAFFAIDLNWSRRFAVELMEAPGVGLNDGDIETLSRASDVVERALRIVEKHAEPWERSRKWRLAASLRFL